MAFSYHTCSSVAEVYDKSRELDKSSSLIWSNALKKAQGFRGTIGTIADLGCGTGRFIRLISEVFPNANIFGVEPSLLMLSKAKEKVFNNNSVTFLEGSCYNTNLPNNLVDVVFMSMVYHHIDDKKSFFLELERVLKDRGLIIIRNSTRESIPTEPWSRYFPEALEVELARSSSREEIQAIFKGNDFSLVDYMEVPQITARNGMEYYEKISMRGLSSLQSISDNVFKQGLSAFSEIKLQNDPIIETIDFFIFQKNL